MIQEHNWTRTPLYVEFAHSYLQEYFLVEEPTVLPRNRQIRQENRIYVFLTCSVKASNFVSLVVIK